MYIPEQFRIREHADVVSFMRAYPFAVLVSCTEQGPFATHLPVVVREAGDHLYVAGHVAKPNPHWRHLVENPDCLTIFHGPHAYISPSNYSNREAVPTWNYGAVHAYGTARIFTAPPELLALLHELVVLSEPAYSNQWTSLSESYRTRMLSHIVGFEIAVRKIEAKFKLSQNRTSEERQKIIDSLITTTDTNGSATAELMLKQGLGAKKS